MAGVLGFEFRLGPEVPAPHPIDFTVPPDEVMWKRHAWATAIREAVQYHDAWGVLRTRPDGDVDLFDAVTPGSLLEATGRGGTVHLLLAREARREAPQVVESLDDLRAAVAGVTAGRPLVLVDRRGWPWTVQADDGLWLVRVPERFAAPRFACELAGEWGGAEAAVREYGPLRVIDGPEVPR